MGSGRRGVLKVGGEDAGIGSDGCTSMGGGIGTIGDGEIWIGGAGDGATANGIGAISMTFSTTCLREVVLRRLLVLSAFAGLIDFITYGGETACGLHQNTRYLYVKVRPHSLQGIQHVTVRELERQICPPRGFLKGSG